MSNSKSKQRMTRTRRAVSPILATVILLGITVVGGGLTFALLSGGASTANSQNIITVENAQGISGTDHTDITATIKNGGSKAWKEIAMTVAKSDLSEPTLYEALHEVVVGTGITDPEVENPLRVQWIASLERDIPDALFSSTAIDEGEGIGVGRKFVASTDGASTRKAIIFNGTAAYALFDKTLAPGYPFSLGHYRNGTQIPTTDICDATAGQADCTQSFRILDPKTKGTFTCRPSGVDIECDIQTHQKLDKPLGSGDSKYLYADALTKDVPGLGNIVVNNGDALVANIAVKDVEGNDARFQTILKVSGA